MLLQSKQWGNGRRGSQGGSGSWGWCCSQCWCASVRVSSVQWWAACRKFWNTPCCVLHTLILHHDLQPDIFTGFLRIVRWVWKCPLQCKSAGVYMHSFLGRTPQTLPRLNSPPSSPDAAPHRPLPPTPSSQAKPHPPPPQLSADCNHSRLTNL